MLHIGKAGGGTLQDHWNTIWKIHFRSCHPHPCNPYRWNGNNNNNNNNNKDHRLQQQQQQQQRNLDDNVDINDGGTDNDDGGDGGNDDTDTGFQLPAEDKQLQQEHPYLIVLLRDPIDRFQSAFYWRMLRICHERAPAGSRAASRRCKRGYPDEAQVLHEWYHQNASALAEDLCAEPTQRRQRAQQGLAAIGHAQHSLSEWLDFEWQTSRIFPIVLESGSNTTTSVTDQGDDAILWLNNETHFLPSPAAFQRRWYRAKHNPRVQTVQRNSAGHHKQDLTPAAQACLLRYYARDYQMLRRVKDALCKTNACRAAIESILHRRGFE